MNETNALILINNIMREYTEALGEVQYCAVNRIDRTVARAKLETCNSIISNLLNLEINECIRHDEKCSFIGISKFSKNGEIISNDRFPVSLGLNFMLNALKLKLLY